MNPLRITPLQMDIIWEDKQKNLQRLRKKLEKICEETDIVILPEMFSTGFSMNSRNLAESTSGKTITTLRQWSAEFQIALAGSYIACDAGLSEHTPETKTNYYNRAFFITPEGNASFYDKRHLFRMGNEVESFTAGAKRPIINYKGWNILLLVCYDLRFPVWSRNRSNEYDILIYTANWPASRRHVWDILLQARALENMSYVCGVNRIGIDGNELYYNGGSTIYSPKGEQMIIIPDHEEGFATASLDRNSLKNFRNKFPVWKDADQFEIQT